MLTGRHGLVLNITGQATSYYCATVTQSGDQNKACRTVQSVSRGPAFRHARTHPHSPPTPSQLAHSQPVATECRAVGGAWLNAQPGPSTTIHQHMQVTCSATLHLCAQFISSSRDAITCYPLHNQGCSPGRPTGSFGSCTPQLKL